MSAPLALFAAIAAFAAATPEIAAQAGPRKLLGGPVVVETLGYGEDARQVARLFTRARRGAPLIVYLHGGGWTEGNPVAGQLGQHDHFTARGYAWATIGYRFVPSVTLEKQLTDVARGIARLRRVRRIDRDRIIVVGHSSGGHLAAMIGTDPRWLAAAGVPFDAVKAVVLLDPAAIDPVPLLARGVRDRHFRPAFGDDPARQRDLSPLAHAAAPNAPAWAMLHDVNNPGSGYQSQQLARDLVQAGAAPVIVEGVTETTHLRLNDDIGKPGDRATALIDGFLARIFPDMATPERR